MHLRGGCELGWSLVSALVDMLATASTCDLVLRLPTRYTSDYETFKTQMVLSLKGCVNFGHI